ncbi:MAG: metallophosphoesterase family protein [Faecalibacterium sp.]
MKILLLADEPCRALYGEHTKERLAGIDLILCAGDLSYQYLEHIANFSCVPMLFVHGNHDKDKLDDIYGATTPGGCINIEDTIYTYKGYRFLGLGGCIRYNPRAKYQYTERQMKKRIKKLFFPLLQHRGFDVLLTHSPAAGINDGPDRAHKGFACFLTLMEKYKPTLFVHGHVHMQYDVNLPRVCEYHDTMVVNAFERYVIELPDRV